MSTARTPTTASAPRRRAGAHPLRHACVLALAVAMGPISLPGCGSSASDAARMQVAREIRDDLKRPLEERRVETLNMTKAVSIATSGRSLDDQITIDRDDDDPTAPRDEAAAELRAIDLAQDAELAIVRGDLATAEALVDESWTQMRTFDGALASVALYGALGDTERLAGRCEEARTRVALDADEVVALLEACRDAHPDGDLSWASDDDRALVAP